jgi:hypothetical protein
VITSKTRAPLLRQRCREAPDRPVRYHRGMARKADHVDRRRPLRRREPHRGGGAPGPAVSFVEGLITHAESKKRET